MTIPASTALPAMEYLLAQLDADAYLSSIFATIASGGSGAAASDNEIAVGTMISAEDLTAAMTGSGGQFSLAETYHLTSEITASVGGDNADPATVRALTMANSLASAVRSDPSLGGLVEKAAPLAWELSPGIYDDSNGRFVRISYTIKVEATL